MPAAVLFSIVTANTCASIRILLSQPVYYLFQISDALTSIKSVNRTDAITLLSNFRSLQNICEASEEDLSLCPGIGPQKAKRIYSILHQSFLKV